MKKLNLIFLILLFSVFADASFISTATTGGSGVSDHGALTGLSDDDHTQYGLLAGRSGGQTLIGGTAASNNLTLQSTSNATRGKILGNDTFSSPGAGASSERYGSGALAAGSSSVAVGNSASSAGNDSIAIGASAVVTGSVGAVAIGKSVNLATVGGGVSIGLASDVTGNDGLAIGPSATAGQNGTAVGPYASATQENFAMGFQAAANTGTSLLALGSFTNASAVGGYAMSIGISGKTDQTGTIILGDKNNLSSGGGFYSTNAMFAGWSTLTDKFYFGDYSVAEIPPETWAYLSTSPTTLEDGTGGAVVLHSGLAYGANATSGRLSFATGENAGVTTIQTITRRLDFNHGNAHFNQPQSTTYYWKHEGALCLQSYSDVSLTADNQAVTVANRSHIVISSNNATATNRTFTLSNGLSDGQMLILEWSGTNAGEIVAATNLKVSATWTPTQYDTINLMWSSSASAWLEISRSTNA